MFWRNWLGLATGWGFGGLFYGLVVAFRMDLAGAAADSLVLMGYVAAFFVLLGSLFFLLRRGVRALVGLVRRRARDPHPAERSGPSRAVASLGGFVLTWFILLALGDAAITLAFRPETSRVWLVVRDLLFVDVGIAGSLLLRALAARWIDKFLVRIRDPRGWKVLAGLSTLLLVVAFLAPMAGAPTPRFQHERSGPPAGLEVRDTGLKVLVFGVDGATWSVFGPLLEDRQLPTTAGLIQRGVHATLVSPPPQVSPAIWTSLVTGRPAEQHGVREYLLLSLPGLVRFPFEALADDLAVVPFFFVGLGYFVAGVAEGIPPTSGQIRTKTLWHMVGDGGGASLLLGWPCTWPAGPVNGLTVSDRFGPNEFDVFSGGARDLEESLYPAAAGERLRASVLDSADDPAPMLRRLTDLSDEGIEELRLFTYNPALPTPASLLTKTYDADMSYLNMLEAELGLGRYRLALIMLNGADFAMHAFWKDRFPGEFGLERGPHPSWGPIIDAYHRLLDRRIGEILAVAGEDTVVVLVSDHGVGAAPANPIWPGWHTPEGLLIMAGGPLRDAGRIGNVGYLDFTPTILFLLGYPVPDDLPGRVLTEVIEEEFLQSHPVRRIPTYE